MLGAIAALLLIPHLPDLHLPNPPFGRLPAPEPRQVLTERRSLPDGWRLLRTRDSFLKTTTCRLERGDVRVASGVVTFSFGHGVDTANALYRLDGGPVRAAGELGPAVAGLGASYLSSNTWNPSDGRVRMPWTVLADARSLDVRANPRRNARQFDVGAIRAAVQAAGAQGCAIA